MARFCLLALRGRRRVIIAVMVIAWAASATGLRAAVAPTIVPRVSARVIAAYARLHAAHLRVSIPAGLTFASASPPAVVRSSPAAGSRVSSGAVVTLYLSTARPASLARRTQSAGFFVPSFVGDRVSAAYAWARRKGLSFTAHLGALKAGGAGGLLANFVVTAQRPRAGDRRMSLLTVWGRQPPPALPTTPSSGPNPSPPVTEPPGGTATAPSAPPPPPTASGDTTTSTSTTPAPPPSTTYYRNPIYSTAPFPDPFVLDNGDTHSDYWAFATGNLFLVLHSTDLVHWASPGTAMTSRPAWVVSTGDWHPWAPSVIQRTAPCPGAASGGCYVMYYVGLSATLSRNCIGVATSSVPGGPYTDQGPLALSGQTNGGSSMPIGCGDATGVGNIDPSPFVDPSGQAYLYLTTDNACSSGSCVLKPTVSVIPLTADLLQASGPRVALFSGDPDGWEAVGASAPTVEGPSMELHDGTYYLFYSGGSYRNAYGMGYATSSSPTGPFTKSPSNPILASTATALSVGGGDRLVTGPHGGLWMVYAARSSSYTNPRMLWLDPFSWNPATHAGAPDVPVIAGPTTTPQSTQP